MKESVNEVLKTVKIKKTEKEISITFRAKHKFIFKFLIFLLILGIIIGGFQLFNYAKFALGYDLTLRLSVDKNDLTLMNGEESQITFDIDKVSNIFCKTYCYYKFTDLSKDVVIDEGDFKLLPSVTENIHQIVSAPTQGEGQVIYTFDVYCKNQASTFCKTEGVNISRRTIITLEYVLSEEQLGLKKEREKELYLAQNIFAQINATLDKTLSQIPSNGYFLIPFGDYSLLKEASKNLSSLLAENLPFWIRQDYNSINLAGFNKTLNQLKKQIDSFNSNLNSNVFTYNSMITSIFSMAQNIDNLKKINLNQSKVEMLENIILDFNQKVSLFDKKTSLEEKKAVFNSINPIKFSDFENQNVSTDYNFSKINLLDLVEIDVKPLATSSSFNVSLPEPKKICCLNNLCQYCAIQKKYPIILLHGHNFNQDISADNIINGFGKIQNRLESLGYLNTGELYLYESVRTSSGSLGTIVAPIIIRPSYYFDFFKKPQGYKSIQIKSENLDTYTLRLREIIENVKYETQSPKVIIITHSMGGLVLRKYIQIFGKEGLDKIILIDSPNAGLRGKISQLCPAFGATSECKDLDSESLFINKLNRGAIVMPKTYNIVGLGCEMAEGNGDGVVLAESSTLLEDKNVKNYFVNGTCSGIDFFHNSVLDIDRYPEVFTIIEQALNE